jgi:uncharacterized protein (DUF302 family)
MTVKQVNVQRFSVTSSKSFRDVIGVFDVAVGHPDMKAFRENVAAVKTYAELEKVVHAAIGPDELMEFTRFDLGEVLRKRNGGAKAPQSLRLVLGNPLIMIQMVEHVPDAGSYAPVTILIDERQDGVHLSYDTMASYLAPYGNSAALKVARDLDAKVEALLEVAAGERSGSV